MSPVSWGDIFTLPLGGDRIMELRHKCICRLVQNSVLKQNHFWTRHWTGHLYIESLCHHHEPDELVRDAFQKSTHFDWKHRTVDVNKSAKIRRGINCSLQEVRVFLVHQDIISDVRYSVGERLAQLGNRFEPLRVEHRETNLVLQSSNL